MRQHLATIMPLMLVAIAAAQSVPVSSHDVDWINASGVGSPVLEARIWYPATAPGVDQPVAPRAGGWPTIVFLHGLGMHGSDYPHLAQALAGKGFVTVMLDTGQWSYQDLEADGRALYAAIGVANAAGSPSPLLEGAFDTGRMGLLGHSMGGGVVGMVLADNPGYRCGMAIAPAYPGAIATDVEVPFGIIVGHGDNITPWPVFSYPYYLDVAPASGLKFLYVLDQSCDHMNIAGLWAGPAGLFEGVVDVETGFFDRFLDVRHSGLERCVGPTAMAQPRLLWFQRQVVEPQVWAATEPTIGTTVRVSVLGEGGLTGVLGAMTTGPGVPTAYGTLMLDLGSLYTLAQGQSDRGGRMDTFVAVPNVPQLIGLPFAMQAAGSTPATALQLGSAVQLFVQ